MGRPRTDQRVPEIGLIPPPQGHLATLPLRYRWEAVRRHPYYQCFWLTALRFHSNALEDNTRDRAAAHIAARVLNMIGVTGPPVNPSNSFADLGECDLHPAWLSGAVRPVSPRGVVPLLLSQLPEADRRFLGQLFSESVNSSAQPSRNDREAVNQALMGLARYESTAMDSLANVPFYFLEMAASQRTIIEDVETICRHWKAERNIEERRIRADKFNNYLRVWDLREGWTGSSYSRSSETPYVDIASQLRQPISSIHNAYRSAFELITGNQYRPDYWRRLFGPIKFSELFTSAADYYEGCYRRLSTYTVRAPVPESVLSPNSESLSRGGFVNQQSGNSDNHEFADLLLDIETLADRGLDDAEIANELEISIEIVSAYRVGSADRNF